MDKALIFAVSFIAVSAVFLFIVAVDYIQAFYGQWIVPQWLTQPLKLILFSYYPFVALFFLLDARFFTL
ncbi:MAG: hypothetical protein ABIH23_35645, partial [bacterium]